MTSDKNLIVLRIISMSVTMSLPSTSYGQGTVLGTGKTKQDEQNRQNFLTLWNLRSNERDGKYTNK